MPSPTHTDDLIAAAQEADSYGDEYAGLVAALANTDDRAVFDVARLLTESPEQKLREIGVDVIAGFGVVTIIEHDGRDVSVCDHPYPDEANELLLGLLPTERDPDVLASIAHGFSLRHEERSVAPLAALRAHPHEEVRYGVVMGLLGREEDVAVEALIALSADEDSDVRNWATFGLGAQIERDTPEIREALAARLEDPDEDAREEGVLGLAVRGDERAVEPILGSYEQDGRGDALDDALAQLAAQTGDERLRPHLVALWEAAAVRGTPLAPDVDESDEHLVAAARRYALI